MEALLEREGTAVCPQPAAPSHGLLCCHVVDVP